MKERLGVILVREGLITPEQRDQALESQILSGGRFGTNLVDMKLLTVDRLGHYLSVQHGLPVASYEDLISVPEEVAQRVPKAHCARYKVFPLAIDSKVLHLAMLDPDDLVAIDELTFLLGLRIQPYVAPQLRLLQVLEKRHGFMRERRFLRIPDEEKTGGGTPVKVESETRRPRISALVPAVSVAEGEPVKRAATKQLFNVSEPPAAPGLPGPAGPSATRAGRAKATAPVRGGAAAPVPGGPPPSQADMAAPPVVEEPPTTEIAAEADLVLLDQITKRPKPAPAAAEEPTTTEAPEPEQDDGIQVDVVGPDEEVTEVMEAHPEAETAVVPAGLVARPDPDGEGATVVVHDRLSLGGLQAAEDALARVEDRDAIIELLVHPFRYQPVLGVLFLVRGEMAVGLAASTAEISAEEVKGLVLPLATPSLLKEAFSRRQVVLGTAKEDPLQQVIARYLRWDEPEEACVAPVSHGERVINLLCVLTRSGTRFPDEIVEKLEHLCATAAKSYVRLIQQHKRPITSPQQPVKADDGKPDDSSAAPARPALPERRFFITGHVGLQGQAQVWRAIDTQGQRVVAVQLLPVGSMRQDEIARLKQQVQILGKLNHPHILRPLAAGVCDDGRPYIVTAYVGEHTLRKRLDAMPTPPHPEVGEIVRQLAEALAAAHARRVTHGDVCPENILFPVADKLQIKLAGFGMPRGIPAGLPRPETARYMAPEGLGGPTSTPADVYSLAAMAYEMLGGRLPIEGESLLAPPELPPLLPGVPNLALNVIARGLARHPEQRPPVAELATELFKVLRTSTG